MKISVTIYINPSNKQFHMKLFKEAMKLSKLDELDSFECTTQPDQSILLFVRTNEIASADFVDDLQQIEIAVSKTAQRLKSIDTWCSIDMWCRSGQKKLFSLCI